MAYDAADNAKIGRDIVERLIGGIRDRALMDLESYQRTGNANYLKNILTMPERRRSRINYCISVLGLDAFRTIIEADGTVTIAELNAELKAKEAHRAALKARLDAGETWDEIIATLNIELDEGPVAKTKKIFDEFFQYEDDFTTMFGENLKPGLDGN